MKIFNTVWKVLEGTGESLNQPSPSKADAFTVIHYLMQIDKPPMDGAEWIDGYRDGVYMAQCHLKGAAQGAAMRGDYETALTLAKEAVSLNGIRQEHEEYEVLDVEDEDEG